MSAHLDRRGYGRALEGSLRREGLSDYVLTDGDSVWVTVDQLSVYIRRVKGGVSVEVYPLGDEASGPPLDMVRV